MTNFKKYQNISSFKVKNFHQQYNYNTLYKSN